MGMKNLAMVPTPGKWRPRATLGQAGQMEWQYQAIDAKEALSARHAFVAFLREACTSKSDCAGAMVVFGELVTNVILHAPGPIEITLLSDSSGRVRSTFATAD